MIVNSHFLSVDYDTRPTMNVGLDAVLDVAQFVEEFLGNRTWLLTEHIALASGHIVDA